MRTTLNLAPEAAAKVRQLAEQRSQTLGAIASELILLALETKGGAARQERSADLQRTCSGC